ncbi:MAG: tRNA (pseudouridine(54)-N(1))-methyltransferase TrmY [Candidatus Methanoperedens sp.]|nr:tRNA (pseudouridine(54)-N(1))-methyltransferase TrmY [Candidatus Methanoperedens sp.]
MKNFLIVGHKAVTETFSLNDLPGAAGRMDILCRCINAALFLSHDLRRDVCVFIVLKGEPSSPKIVRFDGSMVRYLSPDERSCASLIKKALEKKAQDFWTESTAGVSVRKGDMEAIIKELEMKITYLREDGEDIRAKIFEGYSNRLFVLGDHLGLTEVEEKMISECEHETISVGPLSLHADHCIVLLHNEMDRGKHI